MTNLRSPQAELTLDELQRLGASHVVGLPDNSSAALFEGLDNRPSIAHVRVTREGEAFALASGLWLGGAHPVVVVQNTGLLESGDSLRGTAMRMGVPLLCLVTYRGYHRLPRGTADLRGARDAMTRADVDSVAVVTEPTLDAWRVPYELYRSDDDLPRLARATARAESESRPVALLVTESFV